MTTASTTPPERGERRKVLGLLDVTLFTVSAMLVIDQLTASAAIGTKSLGWWLLAVIAFLIPYGLITSELATTYPDQGGIYVWTQKAFGERWAARTTYWYWVNVGLWMPAVFLLFAGVFSQLFVNDWTDWSTGKWPQVLMAIGLTWLVVAVGIAKLDYGKWFNNVGAVLKVAIIFALGVGGVIFAINHGSANSITADSFVPTFGVTKEYLPVIIYMLLGFELISTMAGEVKRPKKDVPKAVFASGIAIAFLYIFATVGILLALPLKQLGLIEGFIDTLKAIFGSSGAGLVLVYILGIGALYTFFTNMTTWSMGANRAAVEAAADGELPKMLGKEHPTRRTPVTAYIIMGLISTATLLFAALFIKTQDSLFYAVFAASSVIFLLPYLLMFPAVLVLRIKDPDRERPFKVPGGTKFLAFLSTVTTLFIAATTLLFVWPEIPHVPADWSYTGPLLGIVAATLVVGEVIIWRLLGRRHKPRPAAPTAPPSTVRPVHG